MAVDRYRVEHRQMYGYWWFALLDRQAIAAIALFWEEADANHIAAALNAAEDAGRWKAALELVEFKAREGHSHRSLAATARAGLNGHDLRRALATTLSRHEARQALKAPEPKETPDVR